MTYDELVEKVQALLLEASIETPGEWYNDGFVLMGKWATLDAEQRGVTYTYHVPSHQAMDVSMGLLNMGRLRFDGRFLDLDSEADGR